MDALECILTRKSTKKYKSDEVPAELIEKIVAAGKAAPTGMNKQSPIILAISNRQVRDELSALNAKAAGVENADLFYGAPVVLAVLAKKDVITHLYDGSLVMGNMLLAAHALGLGACWIHRAKETFEMPEGKVLLKKLGIEGEYEGIGNCIVGYPDGEPQTKEKKKDWVYYVD